MLSTRAMRALRRASNRTLDQTCTVYRLKPVGVGAGDRPKGRERWPDDYEPHLAGEACYVQPTRVRPQEAIGGGQVRMRGEWTIAFKAEIDVNEKQIVKVTSLSNRVLRLIGPQSASYEFLSIWEASEVR